MELDQKIHGKNQVKNAAGIINPRVMKKQRTIENKTKQKQKYLYVKKICEKRE